MIMGGFQGQFKVFKDGLDQAKNAKKNSKNWKIQKKYSRAVNICTYITKTSIKSVNN